MSIPIFIPTIDRAPQLRLLLESLHINAPGVFKPTVMWKATGADYRNGYRKLMKEELGKDVDWKLETNFVKQFYDFIHSNPGYLGFFMDDCIMFRPLPSMASKPELLLDDETWCLSLRLGTNTIVHNYLDGGEQQEMVPIEHNEYAEDFVYWEFREHDVGKNYGFHFSWDGVIFRSQGLLDLANEDQFDKTSNQWAIIPQRIENYFMNHRDDVPQNLMCAPKHSVVICMSYNSTHPHAKAGLKFSMSMEELNRLYIEEDKVIDLNSIDFSNVVSCHEEFVCGIKEI